MSGLRGIRIGEAKNPGPDEVRTLVLNTGGAPGMWRLYEEQFFGAHVIFLQEICMHDSEWDGFARHALLKGYFAYRAPGGFRCNGIPRGGVATLVHKSVRHKFGGVLSHMNTQFVLVWINQQAWINFYCPPDHGEVCVEGLGQLWGFYALDGKCVMVAGDANEVPHRGCVSQFLQARGGVLCGDPSLPTRWEGRHCIDWCFVKDRMATWKHLGFNDVKISDHKGFWLGTTSVARTQWVGRLKQAPKWFKPPSVSVSDWKQALCEAWDQVWVSSGGPLRDLCHVDESGDCSEHIQREWDAFNGLLASCFVRALRSLHDSCDNDKVHGEILKLLRQSGFSQKGLKASHQWFPNEVRTAGEPFVGEGVRSVRRRLARLHELRQRILKDRIVPATLFAKLWKHSEIPHDVNEVLQTVQREISEFQDKHKTLESQQKDRRIRSWKAALTEGSFGALGRWVRGKQAFIKKVSLAQDGVEATCPEEATGLIRQHWQRIWQGRTRSFQDCADQLALDFGVRPAENWPDITAAQLHQGLQHAKGSAGPDHWHSEEVRYLPIGVAEVWATLTQRWLRTGFLPAQLCESRMVNLAKPGKLSDDGVLDAGQTRPISVLSIFWRVFATSMLKTPALQNWADRSLDSRVVGRPKSLSPEAIAARLQHAYAQKCGFLVSLDWSAAYDRMAPAVTCEALSRCGWDPRFARLLQTAWSTQSRWVEWEGHTSPVVLNAGCATPQGCPVAPLTLGFWATAGLRKVEHTLAHDPSSSLISVYMDDRTWWGATWDEVEPRTREWASWSRSVDMKENESKTQVSAFKARDVHNCPDNWKKEEVIALGISSVSKVRKYTPKEKERLTKAEAVASLLCSANLPWKRACDSFRCFVLSKAAYGWICRAPTWSTGSDLLKSLRRVTGSTVRMANKWIWMIFFGGVLHLTSITIQRLWCTLSKINLDWCQNWASPVGVLRKQLRTIGAVETQPWVWQCSSGQNLQLHRGGERRTTPLEAQKHHLREQFRFYSFTGWLNCRRHEVALLLENHSKEDLQRQFALINVSLTRKRIELDSTFRHIALGATVSPAMFNPLLVECPYCKDSTRPSWSHLVWDCSHFLNGRPPRPPNALTARFGWLRSQDDLPVSLHMIQVQLAIWRDRHVAHS